MKKHSTSVFIVEDEFVQRDHLSRVTKSLGYSVVGEALDGQAALSGIARKRPDIVIMDVRLGRNSNGIEIARQLKRQSDIPIIFVTAYGGITREALRSRDGALKDTWLIEKPFADNQLASVLGQVVERTLPPSSRPPVFLDKAILDSAARQCQLESQIRSLRFDEPLIVVPNNELIQRPLHLVRLPIPRQIDQTSPSIATVVGSISKELILRIAQDPDLLRTLNRRLFEQLIAELFAGFGYQVELTAQTRDGGRDVIAVSRQHVAVKYLIECKRPDPGNPISVKPVRELLGVKTDEGATKAILATTTSFTKDALGFFARHQWELEPRDFDGVREWLKDYLVGRK